ncbi:hypothetical protein, partial [Bradyrhizobium japonicum]|uniref:hypothetical protein n=1 Tax=Bradyrhizobium japonicum TaxID=375 RepID=UPI001AEBB696
KPLSDTCRDKALAFSSSPFFYTIVPTFFSPVLAAAQPARQREREAQNPVLGCPRSLALHAS